MNLFTRQTVNYPEETSCASSVMDLPTGILTNFPYTNSFSLENIKYHTLSRKRDLTGRSILISQNILKFTFDVTKYFLGWTKQTAEHKCPDVIENQDARNYKTLITLIFDNLFKVEGPAINTRSASKTSYYEQLDKYNFNINEDIFNGDFLFWCLLGLYFIKRNLNPREQVDGIAQCGRQVEFFIKYVVRDITNIYYMFMHSDLNITDLISSYTAIIVNGNLASVDCSYFLLGKNTNGDKGIIVWSKGNNRYFLNFVGGQTSSQLDVTFTTDSADLIYMDPLVNDLYIFDSKYYSSNNILNKGPFIFIQCLLYFLQNWMSLESQIMFNDINNIYLGYFIFIYNRNRLIDTKGYCNYTSIKDLLAYIAGNQNLYDELLKPIVIGEQNYKFTEYLKLLITSLSSSFPQFHQINIF